jgi:tellurium resistance protein TerD
MAVILQRGDNVVLTEVTPILNEIEVYFSWLVNKYDGVEPFDIDAAVFLLNENDKVNSNEDFIFYGNPTTYNDSVVHTVVDCINGDEIENEVITINLNSLPHEIKKAKFFITISNGRKRKQNFECVSACVCLKNKASGEELLRYNLDEGIFTETAVLIGELYRHDGNWIFTVIGSGYQEELSGIARDFGVDVQKAMEIKFFPS